MNEKDILMYYHTTFRNIGLYTSVSVAMLGYSRFYRGKNKAYNLAFIIISLMFLIFSLIVTKNLIQMVEEMNAKVKDPIGLNIDHLSKIPKYVFITNCAVFVFGLYTLVREIREKLL